ncbi:hypothetical protein JCM10450v2_007543 [Rhodotorula kratochvilovae]
MAALELTYTITHPSALPTPPPAFATLPYTLDTSTPLAHLQSLEAALGQARADLNERLTEWKDALKDVEKVVKKKKGKKDDDEEDEEEEEDA